MFSFFVSSMPIYEDCGCRGLVVLPLQTILAHPLPNYPNQSQTCRDNKGYRDESIPGGDRDVRGVRDAKLGG